MGKKLMVDDSGMDVVNDGESTTLSVENYPELEGVQVGETISGKWSGKVTKSENGSVTIEYDSMELETENSADRELRGMMKQPQMMTEKE